ncbi:MAG: hypothetical protein ACREJQ_03475, partial [bacterium]
MDLGSLMASVVEIGGGASVIHHHYFRFPIGGVLPGLPAIEPALATDAALQAVRSEPCVARLTIRGKKERMALGDDQNKRAVPVSLQNYYQLDEEWQLPETLLGRTVYA